jgi:integrase
MSVFKRKGAKTYEYDFWEQHRRFTGDTGKADKREARVELERQRVLARELMTKLKGSANGPLTFGVAAARYMNEVGTFQVNALTTLASLEWLERAIGKNTPLTSITDSVVAKLVARRRAEHRRVGNKKTAKRPVGPATVNRTMTEPLRKVLRRAAKTWKVPVGEVEWSQHMLDEPQERVREASKGEEAKIMAELGRGYDVAVRFAFINGCRRMEIVGLKNTDVDFFGRQFTVTGKGGRQRVIPMNDATYDLLWSIKDDPTDYVFTYVAARTDPRKKLVKGQRYRITDAGLKTAMRRKTAAAGVENFRFHDTRHTAATRVLRKSNLRVVQELLGHADVATTTKYAHAMKEDVRAALNAASPVKSPVQPVVSDDKPLKENGNG